MERREALFGQKAFSLNNEEKREYYGDILQQLSVKHYEGCPEYKNLMDSMGFDVSEKHDIEKYPFIPVRMFKEMELCSVPRDQVVKTMTSSGTTGQQVSKIFLDKTTSVNQSKVLMKITTDMLGGQRFPMLVIDSKNVIKDRKMFSARGAGILGFSMLGRDTTYALDENMSLDIESVKAFLQRHKDETILLFGFTFIIWEHFYKVLKASGEKLDISNGILLHGGGFKKLIEEAVDNDTYKERLNQVCGINRVCNYYGMVEQTGSIYMECECGRLHTSNYSDIIIRKAEDFSVCQPGEQGLIQLISTLPDSYPGFSILSEDIGELIGEDDCPCGRYGKTFKIIGRIKKAEVRGCSDTYEKR